MTEDDALELHDFLMKRIFGWTIVIGCNNPSGRMDGRYKPVKVADRLFRDAYLMSDGIVEFIEKVKRDEDPVLSWPEPYREFVRFCLWHRCPREANEPFSEEEFPDRPQRRVWPEFLKQYDKPATLEDMPPLPEPSDRVLKLEAARNKGEQPK